MTDAAPKNMWDERYAAKTYVFGTEPNAFMKRQTHRLGAGQSVLAVADGEGRNGVFLAQQGLTVTSIDSSPVGQAKARALAESRGVSMKFECADLSNWVFPNAAFDTVVGIFIQFAGPALRTRLFDGMKRALKPGGLLLLEGYRPEQLAYGTGGPPQAENMYTEALLREAFGDFEILELASYDAAVREGPGHDGMSALIDLIARKPA